MSRPKRTPRARTVLRRRNLVHEKLVRAKNALLELEPGGNPRHPIEVSTPAVIESKARSLSCPRCDEAFVVESHEARSGETGRLREVKLGCRRCGGARSLWFRVTEPS